MNSFDVIVIGVGAMGAATCLSLAKRGVRVLGIEQFHLAHALGSSHGSSRLIRKAYFEHPNYVPLCTRSYTLWDQVCAESERDLFHRTGLLIFGPDYDAGVLRGVLESARLYGVDVEKINAGDTVDRFPQVIPPRGYSAVLEPDAGYLEVERCVETMASLAERHGAVVHTGETVTGWVAKGDGIQVTTTTGEYEAARLVVTAGPWSSQLLHDLELPLVVRRVPQFWFDAPPALHVEQGMPCFAFDMPDGFIYGMPAMNDRGLKLGCHVPGEVVPNLAFLQRELLPGDLDKVEHVRSSCFRGLSTAPEHFAICMYTMTPDEHSIVDVHPRLPQVSFAAGFSGHGFKFAPVVGEVMADLALDGKTAEPVDFLRMR